MDTQGTKASIIVTIVVLAVATSAIVLVNLPDDESQSTPSGVNYITILANSTDILYPELMEASFMSEEGQWVVTANFVDNSGGWESPEVYDRTFSASVEEIDSISEALWASINLTVQSEEDPNTILNSGASIGFHIVITYVDGSWIAIWTLLTETGHILYKSGVGTPDLGMDSAELLEPVSALDNLVSTVYSVFSNNLES